jgi:glycosyltransferase involved in cell wall biosynthesis
VHIAIIAFTYLYWSGGAERYADETARNLAARGHRVTIYAADFLIHRPAPRRTCFPCRVVGVPVIWGPGSRVLGQVWDKNRVEDNFHTLAPAWLIADHLRGQGADLIYGQVSGALVGLRARKYTGTPVVCASYNTRWGYFEKYKRWLTLHSDGLVTLNAVTLADHQALAAPDPLPPVFNRPGSVNTTRYHPAQRSAAYRQRLGVADDEVLILTLQRMDGRKNMTPVLEACLQIVRQQPQVRVFVGGGGPNKAQYEAWVQAQPGGERVRFLGFVPDEDLPTLYASSDLFVAATYGYVNLEAMAAGCATLVLDHQPQCREFVNDGVGGLLVPEDSAALTAALAGLLADPARRARLSAAGRQFILEHFDDAASTAELIAFFEQVRQQGPAARPRR